MAEAAHDRAHFRHDTSMEQARENMRCGLLDDWFEDVADTHDTFVLAASFVDLLDELDEIASKKGDALEKTVDIMKLINQTRGFLNLCALKDFRATREWVIEQHAEQLGQDQ
jgi:hypothetical protein